MDAYAVIETGGKQYRVKADDTVRIERLKSEVGESAQAERVLAVSDGEALTVGTPTIDGANVTFTVVDHIRGEKVINFKKKRRKGYSRKVGHRQEHTIIKIDSVA
jgi:large subunit ribosomal protein L21